LAALKLQNPNDISRSTMESEMESAGLAAALAEKLAAASSEGGEPTEEEIKQIFDTMVANQPGEWRFRHGGIEQEPASSGDDVLHASQARGLDQAMASCSHVCDRCGAAASRRCSRCKRAWCAPLVAKPG
jgi:hypothetical protein